LSRVGPTSSGAVPAAGVVLIKDRGIFRYDGATGILTQVAPDRSGGFAVEVKTGAYLADPGCEGTCEGSVFIAWDGSSRTHGCRGSVSVTGACAWADGGALRIRAGTDPAERTILPPGSGTLSAEWDPDGRRLLLVRSAGSDRRAAWLMDDRGQLQDLGVTFGVGFPGELTSLQWSPNGRWIDLRVSSPPQRSGLFESVRSIDPTGGMVTTLVEMGANRGESVWWGDRLAATVGGACPTAIELTDGTTTTLIRPRLAAAHIAAVDPSGTRLAWIETPCAGGALWEPAGQRLVLADQAGTRTEIAFPGRAALGARWASDGETLLVGLAVSGVPAISEIWLAYADGRTPVPLVTGIAWSFATSAIGRDQMTLRRSTGDALGLIAWSKAVP
jgi:hypothetical protein